MAKFTTGRWRAWWRWLGASSADEQEQWVTSSSFPPESDLLTFSTKPSDAPRRAQVFMRLWLGFMTARVMVALVLVLMPWFLWQLRAIAVPALSWAGMSYLVLTVVQRWQVGTIKRIDFSKRLVGICIVVDIVAIALLNDASVRVVNYYPLLALPLLYASILGTRMQALGAAAALALLLLFDVWGFGAPFDADSSTQHLQAAFKGAGAFVAAWLVHQLSLRLDREIHNAQVNRRAARAQIKINELVLAEMTDGVLVTDDMGRVSAANPAALMLLGMPRPTPFTPFTLSEWAGWELITQFVQASFVENQARIQSVEIQTQGQGMRGLRLSSRLIATPSLSGQDRSLCVVFMEDLQEVQARVRQEKMAAMGRMSAAVAHEIRNPLTAIVQANALMREEVQSPNLQKMTAIVAQNAQRIAQTVEDVLDVSRFPRQPEAFQISVVLQDEVAHLCQEWSAIHHAQGVLQLTQTQEAWRVRFDAEHLRRVLINLLDNARRHTPPDRPQVCVWTGLIGDGAHGQPCVVVWNAGEPLDATIERHLFEPFFSSQTRSSGLGLYICKQLCEMHQAAIVFKRSTMPGAPAVSEVALGNQFMLTFQWAHEAQPQGLTGSIDS